MRRVLLPIATGIGALVAWQVVVDAFDIAPYVLPGPQAIASSLHDFAGEILDAAEASGTNALIGLVAGTLLGVLVALVASRLSVVDGMLAPLAAAANAMPIVALAPMFNTMFGTTSSVPRRLVVTVVVFFPVFVNTLRGLRDVDPVQAEVLRSCAASPWQVTRTLRLPGALPHAFTGVRLASALSVITAVVAEYFGGLQDGLGARITSAAANTAYPRAWAYVTAACALGLAFYVVALVLERVAVPWRASTPS
ncbi:NitT/TauT family transport system permease protein [Motilibacter rhizosphaerae]|uniref:NitT/TauT family transport system permease protein n=1 Tax=Motilibacter rhizosphaerae TaxID=598652 RepID=A0A4V2F500_9ACTN|nr:ABC transporter permease subunit [Motilibacter rhizosphaerae]RZS91089.1 NitT/TauT family transport system permease protein [Motilibacter rhizosphaerae]